MKGVIENVVKYSPRAIIIVVANPMDTLTYLALKASGLPKNRIIGMGGALDSSRFKCYLAKATGANINNVDGMVIGGHGDTTMIPLVSKATVNGVPVSQFASKKKARRGHGQHDGGRRNADQGSSARRHGTLRAPLRP